MANIAQIKETWDKRYQVNLYKIPVYPAIASFEAQAGLKKGDTIHRVKSDELIAYDMGSEGEFTRQDFNESDETLSIDKAKDSSFYLKELDRLQSHLPIRDKHANSASAAIFNQIDGDILGSYDQYSLSLDDGAIGGTSGNGISVTTSNVYKLFTGAKKLMQRHNVALDLSAHFTGVIAEDRVKRYGVAIITPDVYEALLQYAGGKDSMFGDAVSKSGHVGHFMGFEMFLSNATGWSGVLSMATLPTDGDTITINGVTFTFKTTLGSAAGNVLIGASAATANANLAALINDPKTTTTEGVALSESDQKLLRNITATASSASVAIKATGWGYVSVSETLTDATDTWTAEKQVQHLLFGVNGMIDVAIQKTPNLWIDKRGGYVGYDIVTWAAYGYKVFTEQKYRGVDVQVRTDAY